MKQNLNPAVAKVLKRLHYPLDVILLCVRWYVAYPLSLRHLEQMMAERGISVDHSTVHRWALKLLPVLEKAFLRCRRAVGRSWRMDEKHTFGSGANGISVSRRGQGWQHDRFPAASPS
jgi:putative transposase